MARRPFGWRTFWRSIFRHGYEDTRRNRILQITSNVWLHLHPRRIQRHAVHISYTWCAGGLTFMCFLVTLVTGTVLMFYYRPVAEYAFPDIQYLASDVPFGAFLRNMHRWSSHAMVILVFLHMFRVFMTGSYKPPREFNWVVGVSLLVLTLLMSFTGYLLPWDQLSMWAVTVGTSMAGAAPLVGHEGPAAAHVSEVTGLASPRYDLRALLVGGTQVGPATLLRFYVLHCIFIPLVAGSLMMLHFWRVRKDSGVSGPL